MSRGVGIAKRGFGKALSRTGYAEGGDVNEYKDELEGAISGLKEIKEEKPEKEKSEKKDFKKIEKYLKNNIKFVTPGLKKGGSAKPGLWANINRRKKLGISRPKSESTISKKAYANMKAGFPKKKK
jgi:hypothetical protein